MRAEIADRDAVGELARHERAGRFRQHDLTAVAGRCDPCGAVDLHPDVVVATDDALSRVESDPDPDVAAVGPCLIHHGTLRGDRGSQGADGGGEHDEEGVSFGANLHAFVLQDGRPHDRCMRILSAAVLLGSELPKQPGGAFDVAEQERHRA